MRGRSYSKLRETAFDLYNESERLPWYYKALSTASAWMVLAGYVIFSIAYSTRSDELRVPMALVTTLAIGGVVVGYLSDALLAYLSHSLVFIFDGVLMPVLTASAVGFFSTIIHRALKKTPEGHPIYLYVPLALSTVATIVAGITSFFVYKKLRHIKEVDRRRRNHISADGYSPSTTRNFSQADDQQRRQLAQLLHPRTERQTSNEDSGSTYHIDLPGEEGSSRQRSDSMPTNTKPTARFPLAGPFGRDRSGTGETFKDPRERRREQIEKGGLINVGSAPNSAGLTSAWHGQQYSPSFQSQTQ